MRPVPSTAPKQTQVVCYRCGKPGHIRPKCPLHRGKPHAAVARMDELEEGNPVEDYPEAEGQEGDPPVTQVKQKMTCSKITRTLTTWSREMVLRTSHMNGMMS